MARKHVCLKTKQTLQFGKPEKTVSYKNSNRPDSNYNTCLIEMSIVKNRAHAGAPAFQKPRIMFRCIIVQFTYAIHSLAWNQVIACLICNLLSISRVQLGVSAPNMLRS